jgi:uncharacterized protein YdaU (DUF1376 family)
MQKPPAFQFYAKDWITGTMTLSPAARGIYITLLAYQWDHGGVPAGEKASLSRAAQCDVRTITKFWPEVSKKFRLEKDGLWRNAKLKAQWRQVRAYRKLQSLNGKRGGRPKSSSSSSSVVSTHPLSLPSQGGTLNKPPTRQERKWADQFFSLRTQNRLNRCPHDPPCRNHTVCLGRLVQDKRRDEAQGQTIAREESRHG